MPSTGLRKVGEEDGPRPAEDPGQEAVLAFGRILKLLRVRVGIPRDAFGAQSGYSPSNIASFEQSRRIPPPRGIERADQLLDAGGVLEALKEDAGRRRLAFFRDMVRLEAEAAHLLAYDTHVLNGLLQTEEYMRAGSPGTWTRIGGHAGKQSRYRRRPTENLRRSARSLM